MLKLKDSLEIACKHFPDGETEIQNGWGQVTLGKSGGARTKPNAPDSQIRAVNFPAHLTTTSRKPFQTTLPLPPFSSCCSEQSCLKTETKLENTSQKSSARLPE